MSDLFFEAIAEKVSFDGLVIYLRFAVTILVVNAAIQPPLPALTLTTNVNEGNAP
ncbi:MAG: hypothetical protein U9N63_08895 [Pseudomonadota bacterium]|nr:hypothetical protein [Pseudomonadota bacterium]